MFYAMSSISANNAQKSLYNGHLLDQFSSLVRNYCNRQEAIDFPVECPEIFITKTAKSTYEISSSLESKKILIRSPNDDPVSQKLVEEMSNEVRILLIKKMPMALILSSLKKGQNLAKEAIGMLIKRKDPLNSYFLLDITEHILDESEQFGSQEYDACRGFAKCIQRIIPFVPQITETPKYGSTFETECVLKNWMLKFAEALEAIKFDVGKIEVPKLELTINEKQEKLQLIELTLSKKLNLQTMTRRLISKVSPAIKAKCISQDLSSQITSVFYSSINQYEQNCRMVKKLQHFLIFAEKVLKAEGEFGPTSEWHALLALYKYVQVVIYKSDINFHQAFIESIKMAVEKSRNEAVQQFFALCDRYKAEDEAKRMEAASPKDHQNNINSGSNLESLIQH
ncbi:unnamed protein product [Caenorhabditis angaria]|uniref:Uncharacterized protein n=1 Tax=Caenorhabditis angaria TaxID=860376 RepID=A0A9P1NBD0_9PELO|nr:unnamed protein product [Caenorhabditis angaria]